MPPYGQGTSESLTLGFENGFKTMPNAPVTGDKVPVTSPNIRPERNKFTSNALTGSHEPRPIVFGKVGVSGSFGLECNPASLMPVCKGLFGGVRSSGVSGVFAVEYYLSTMLPMFIQQSHADINQYLLWNGIYLGSTTWQFGSEGLMECTVNVMGAKQSVFSATQIGGTVTDRTGYEPFSYLLVRIKQGGTVIGYSQAVELTIDRKLGKAMAQDQTNEVAVVFSEVAEIMGKMTALFQDATLLNLALSGAETSLEIWLPSINGFGLLVELPTIKFRPPAVVTNGTGLVTQELEFDVYGKAGVSLHPGRVRSNYISGSTTALDTLTLVIAVDGGADQTVTFANPADVNAVVTQINAQTTGLTASLDRAATDTTAGVIRIESDTKGTTSSVVVKAASTADVILGFDNAVHSGLDGKSILVTILTPVAA
ncbi:MAG TPA: phage tail tube protein [Gemmatimonadaceae bacterium]